jgi:hypothetical protein
MLKTLLERYSNVFTNICGNADQIHELLRGELDLAKPLEMHQALNFTNLGNISRVRYIDRRTVIITNGLN